MSYKTKPLPKGVPTKEERVRHLMGLMASGGYYGHTTCHELAEAWHVSWQTVAQDAAEAGRFLRLDPDFRGQKQAELSGWAHALAKHILTQPSRVTGLPDYKSAIEAMRLAANWLGIADRVVEQDNSQNVPKAPVTINIIKSKGVPTETAEPQETNSKSDAKSKGKP